VSTFIRLTVAVFALLAASALTAEAQVTPMAPTITPCSARETSSNLPPADSGPLYRCAELMPHGPGDRVTVVEPMVDPRTYAALLTPAWTQRSAGRWMPYDERILQEDFWKLWRSEFLEDLWIEVIDEPFENGVVGKHVIFHYEERARVKVVDYVPADPGGKLVVPVSDIEKKLREEDISVRLDSFIDEAVLRRVIGVIRGLYAEKGYNDAVVETQQTPVAGGQRLIHLTFRIDPGPKVEIAEVVFDGNEAFSDRKLRGQMAHNKPNGFFGFLGDATYNESLFAEDAARVTDFYRRNGYAAAQVGQPVIEDVRRAADGSRRWIRLRIPVDEGPMFTVGNFELTGESDLNLEAVKTLFEIQPGDVYNVEKLRKGMEKATEVYGSFGYWQFEPIPNLQPRGELDPETGEPIGEVEPIMDIEIEMVPGEQFFVNRITFVGNTTTHDSVIRRELRVAEGGLFNAQALKDSVRRLNQLGYFQPLEGTEDEMDVVPTPGEDDKVDITMRFEEQNRNQLTFGAGVSQFDGFFGQLAFQTSNFLGRGETVGVSLQKGSQARNYQLSFSEPYLFDRPITVGADVYSREYIFPLQYTQQATGTNLVFGYPLANYTRMFVSYAYEQISVKDINPIYTTPEVINRSPYLADALLTKQGGRRIVSRVTPSLVFNTVNRPIFPTAGTRYSASIGFAGGGLGGNTDYVQGSLEGIWYVPLSARNSLGFRAQTQYVRPYGRTETLPIFEKLFSGGEYTMRGFDLRTVGPRDPETGVLIGGNKMMVFNAEYYFDVMSQLRLVAFFDAGQVKDIGQPFGWKEDIIRQIQPDPPYLSDLLGIPGLLTPEGAIRTEVIGQTSAFKTSTGLEVRFMMPVLNVPFRLIGAYNPHRGQVFNHQGRPTERFTFRFAVGTTF
jgi:outer membrane protein insertion porin family